jgi:hypothetical protein
LLGEHRDLLRFGCPDPMSADRRTGAERTSRGAAIPQRRRFSSIACANDADVQ